MADGGKHSILVVDDTEANVDLLVETLSDEYEVSVTMDGPSALEIAASEDLDVILLDIMMPEMDGYEVCRRLKSTEKTRDIPVIFVTAMSEIQDETKGFDLGAVDYITKPVSPPIVKARIRSVLTLKDKTEQLADLSQKLSKYLAPQVYVSIFRGEQDVKIEAKRKKLTIYFSDIVGFTSTSEGMEAEDLTNILNRYLEKMSEIAIKHGGTIDKFIGDAILIFFGDPLSRGIQEDAMACVSMAIEMRDEVKKLQKEWYTYGIENPFQIRAGVSTGFCTVGNFGSRSRMGYTIIGSQVNIASRMESSADPDQIVISHETWALVRESVSCIKQKPITVKDISHPIQTYQVVDYYENAGAQDETFLIGYLTESALNVSPDHTVRELAITMQAHDSQNAAVVLQDSNPVGLVMNYRLRELSASQDGIALYFDQPVSQVMDDTPLVVEGELPLNQVAKKVMARDRQKVYDPIVVVEDGVYKGIVPVHSILGQMTEADKA